MNRLLRYGLLPLLTLSCLGCTSNTSLDVGGVPKWIAGGATLDHEPKPYRPDPAIIVHENESGPVEFGLITDRRFYPAPPAKVKKPEPDLLERGRDRRIRRLFR